MSVHVVARLSGVAAFVYLHALIGADSVHRLACLKGPFPEEDGGYQGLWPEFVWKEKHALFVQTPAR